MSDQDKDGGAAFPPLEALRAIADLTAISGGEFKARHPELNAKLDKAGIENWATVLSEHADAALSARPDAPDVRTVTVAQLERLLNTLAELDGHTKLDDEIRDSVIEEIRAIIGGMK